MTPEEMGGVMVKVKKRYAVIRWFGRISGRHVSGAYCWCVKE